MHDALQCRRNLPFASARHLWRVFLQDGGHCLHRSAPLDGALPRKHLVKQCTEGINIREMIDAFASHQLR